MLTDLAPAGSLKGRPEEAIAEERSRINSARFRAFGLGRTYRWELGTFLRRLALFPDKIPRGSHYGMPPDAPIMDIIDHVRLYNRNRKPYAAILHPYTRINTRLLKGIAAWTEDVGLDVCIDADSEYYPGVTLRVIFYRAGTEFPETNLA